MQRALAVAVLIVAMGTAREAGAEPERTPSSFAVRAGWAYGLGVELEFRPRQWGIGASGGYVPGFGFGGYLGAQWGLRPLAKSGLVAEAGMFRGVHNPLRVAATGLGIYALGGYAIGHADLLSVRAVVGAGIPVTDPDHRISFEFLAKLTVGVVF